MLGDGKVYANVSLISVKLPQNTQDGDILAIVSNTAPVGNASTGGGKGKQREKSGGAQVAQTMQQETYQDPFTYAIVAIGAFAAMMIGLQK